MADDSGVSGGGGGSTTPVAPKNFVPLKNDERTQWNNFLEFVNSKGYGGSADLDKRDKSIGLGLMQQYQKVHPEFSIKPEDIQRIQYDQYLLRKGDSYPTVSPQQLAYMRNGLGQAYLNRPISPVDNWLGSITSKLYYPTAVRAQPNGQINFGTNFEDYVNSLNDPKILDKYTNPIK